MSIHTMSGQRALRGEMDGKPARPWEDENRDFAQEAREELADADNYVFWLFLQNTDVAGLSQRLDRVRDLLRRAFMEIDGAQEIIDIERGRKLRPDQRDAGRLSRKE